MIMYPKKIRGLLLVLLLASTSIPTYAQEAPSAPENPIPINPPLYEDPPPQVNEIPAQQSQVPPPPMPEAMPEVAAPVLINTPNSPLLGRPAGQSLQKKVIVKSAKEIPAPKSGKKGKNGIEKNPTEKKTVAEGATMDVDYVDEPILDVLRAIATSYQLSIIPEKDIGDVKVTIHLERIPVLDGLKRLCNSHGLELIAEGSVYRVKKTTESTLSVMEMQSKKMNIDVQNKPIKDFIRDFVEKTKINIVPGSDLSGAVSGHLKDVIPLNGFKALMDANGYDVRLKNGVYVVEKENNTSTGQPGGFARNPRRGGFGQGSGSTEIDVQDGRVTLSLNNSALGDAVREIAEQADMNYAFIGEVNGNVTAQLKNVSVEDALSLLLQGTRFSYLKRNGVFLIGDRNPNTPSGQALSGAELCYLKFIKVENIEKLFPKTVPAENIKVIKEQNAVLISGTGEDIKLVKDFINQVDLLTPQVLMEVVIVEYNRTNTSDLGIKGGKQDPKIFGPSLNANARLSGLNSTFSAGMFSGAIGVLSQDFNFYLNALESRKKAKVLARPKITTLNGNKADIKVNRSSYFKVASVSKDNFQNVDFRAIEDGISLELTPWVTKHGEVNVTISPSIKTTEVSTQEGVPGAVTNRAINTQVSLMDGQTVALGGLIQSKQTVDRAFLPILGSIPFIGYLFSSRSLTLETSELVIYITPHILNPEEAGVDLKSEFKKIDGRDGNLKDEEFIKNKELQEKKVTSKADTLSSVKIKKDSVAIIPNSTSSTLTTTPTPYTNSNIEPTKKGIQPFMPDSTASIRANRVRSGNKKRP